jgi:DNA-binding HxlR family transcriptional regulator
VACTLDVLGDRWTLLVVRDLIRGKRRFAELVESPSVSRRTFWPTD